MHSFFQRLIQNRCNPILSFVLISDLRLHRLHTFLGLNLIREFLKLNGGKIQIVSDDGYWDEKANTMDAKELSCNFIGTIVNLEFNLDDPKSYLFSSEVDKDDIF